MIENKHIKTPIFLYDENLLFLKRFDGIRQASVELKIYHRTIKKYALTNTPYQGYVFSYNRILPGSYFNGRGLK
jgi:hypothetical protein